MAFQRTTDFVNMNQPMAKSTKNAGHVMWIPYDFLRVFVQNHYMTYFSALLFDFPICYRSLYIQYVLHINLNLTCFRLTSRMLLMEMEFLSFQFIINHCHGTSKNSKFLKNISWPSVVSVSHVLSGSINLAFVVTLCHQTRLRFNQLRGGA